MTEVYDTKTVSSNAKQDLDEMVSDFQFRRLKFPVPRLNVVGDISVKVNGFGVYDGITRCEISYKEPIGVKLRGVVGQDDRGIAVQSGVMKVSAERVNPAEKSLYKNCKIMIDPDLVIFQGNKRIELNQVQAAPVLHIREGYIEF